MVITQRPARLSPSARRWPVLLALFLFAPPHAFAAQQPQPSPDSKKVAAPPGRRPPKRKLTAKADFSHYAGRDASNRLIFGAATRNAGRTTASAAAYDRGIAALKEGNAGEALRRFEEAASLSPGWADARYGLGAAYARLGEHEKAVAEFSRVVELSAGDELLRLWAYYGMGNSYAEAEDYEAAAESYKGAIKIRPELSKPHYNLGLAHLGLDRKQDALSEFREAVRLNPQYAEARYNLGVLALELGDRREAEEQRLHLQSLNEALADRLDAMLKGRPR